MERALPGENQRWIAGQPRASDLLKLLQYLSWAFLTFQVAVAIYRSLDDPWTIAFVIGSYLNLLLLFCSLHWFEKARENSAERKWLRYVVWLLASSVIVAFSYKTATIMPVTLKVIVWAMAAIATVGGFYAVVICSDK